VRIFDAMILAMAVTAIEIPQTASGQPNALSACLSRAEWTCSEVGTGAILTPCAKVFERFAGRIAFYPLVLTGPITIEVETKAFAPTFLPLFVEVVPLTGVGGGPCDNTPGQVVLVSNGNNDDCGGVDSRGPIDLTHGGFLKLGDLYALRLHSFGSSIYDTPGVDCVRVIPQVTSVTMIEWSTVKQLYR
jgi:hypothetical protein